jgi:hypothetical protein
MTPARAIATSMSAEYANFKKGRRVIAQQAVHEFNEMACDSLRDKEYKKVFEYALEALALSRGVKSSVYIQVFNGMLEPDSMIGECHVND